MTLEPTAAESFRATKAWNTIVSAVRSQIPVGRHRKGFKIFTNCFAGSRAVSWLLDYLMCNRQLVFDSQSDNTITREKVTLLLQKFVEQKIIEDVQGCGKQFKDSAHRFYVFNSENVLPLATFRLASIKDKGRIQRTRRASLTRVPAQPAKYATSMVKLALVDLSASKEQHQEASSIR